MKKYDLTKGIKKMELERTKILILSLFIIIFTTACSSNPPLCEHKVQYSKAYTYRADNPTQKRANKITKLLTVGAMVYMISAIPNGSEVVKVLGNLFLENKRMEAGSPTT